MAKIEKYEDLKCLKQARALVNEIYELVRDSSMKHEYGLSDQLTEPEVYYLEENFIELQN